jgi:RNA polymerase sigma-70 factor, ECF subfamily
MMHEFGQGDDIVDDAPLADFDEVDELAIRARNARWLADPDAAIAELHHAYASRIMGFCMTMLRSREDAEDAVQTTFMNAYHAIVAGRVPRQEVSWLFRIARNTCLNRIRTWQRKPAGSLEGVDVVASSGIEDMVDQRMLSAALRSAIGRLPEQQRIAIVLRELQGASYAEIAEYMGTTQGAVESLLFRARRHLVRSMRPVRDQAAA